jgi:hypothetical protein
MSYHEQHERKCPTCGERISATAPKCFNCGEYVVDDDDDEEIDDEDDDVDEAEWIPESDEAVTKKWWQFWK